MQSFRKVLGVHSDSGIRSIMICLWQCSKNPTPYASTAWRLIQSLKNFCQCCYGISFPGIGGIFTLWWTNSLTHKSSGTRPRYVDHTSSSPAQKGIWYPRRWIRMLREGNVHGARPSCSPLWYFPITSSQMPLQDQCTYSGATSTRGFSTGSVTISVHLV